MSTTTATLKTDYKAAKAAFESTDSSTSASEKERLQTVWKSAKKAYKKSKNTTTGKDADDTSTPATQQGGDDDDIIAKANAAFFAADTPVDTVPIPPQVLQSTRPMSMLISL